MASKKLIRGENKPKRKNEWVTIQQKKEIIDTFEKGAGIINLTVVILYDKIYGSHHSQEQGIDE